MRVRPVVKNAETVVHAVAESLGQPLSLDSVLDVDVFRAGAEGFNVKDFPETTLSVLGPSADVDDWTVRAHRPSACSLRPGQRVTASL